MLREHYLRPDIPCGSKLCADCADLYELAIQQEANLQSDSDTITNPSATLSRSGRTPNAASNNANHYILPDTNVFLHQVISFLLFLHSITDDHFKKMDVLEAKDFGADVIVLQTVLDEVRHRSLPLFNRLQTLLDDVERRFSLFSNEARPCVLSQF